MNDPVSEFAPKPRPRVVPIDHVEDAIYELSQTVQPSKPTDREYVANSIDMLRYLDLMGVAKDIIGDAKPTSPAELAELMATWASTNKTRMPT
jgi:hypothetical protein